MERPRPNPSRRGLERSSAFLLFEPTPSEADIKITRDIIHGSCELHEKNLWNAAALPKATVAEADASGVQLLCGRRLMCVSIHEESTGSQRSARLSGRACLPYPQC